MAKSVSRPFAVFDIDGTLIRWQLYHAIADELARQGHFGLVEYEAIKAARMNWKKRSSLSSYRDYEQSLINLVDAAMNGISQAEFDRASQTVLAEYKDQVYTFTRDLIRRLKTEGYLLFAISASHESVVRLLADYYGFDDCGGSTYETRDGYFTGEKMVLKRERKPERLKALVEAHGASWKGSIAVGDSESDIPMLASVERAIAFNPTAELFAHARDQQWQVVIERKNVIYELTPDKSGYSLAN